MKRGIKLLLSTIICIVVIFMNETHTQAISKSNMPSIKQITLNKRYLEPDENLVIKVLVNDNAVSDIEKIYIDYFTPNSEDVEKFSFTLNSEKEYISNRIITKNDETGTWRIGAITVQKKSGNKEVVYNSKSKWTLLNPNIDLNDYSFNVSDYTDIEKPEWTKISMSNNRVKIGDKITFNTTAKDLGNGYIREFYLCYLRPGSNIIDSLYFKNVEDDYYVATKTITEHDTPGEWKLGGIYIVDNHFNEKLLANSKSRWAGNDPETDLSEYTFFIENEVKENSTEKPTTEAPITERPTTEKPTTEKPTTEKPTTEAPTTERPTNEVPTVEAPTTESPSVEQPKTIRVAVPSINEKVVSNASKFISGRGTSNSTVYAKVGSKVIGSAKVSKGNFAMKIKPQAAGVKVTVYAVYKNVKSASKTVTVLDRIAPAVPLVDKVTYKSIYITGSGEKAAKVFVYNGTKKVAAGTVASNGKFKVKIVKQKKNTKLSVYLVDKAGNKGKARAVKVY